jgi:hypothetical protein
MRVEIVCSIGDSSATSKSPVRPSEWDAQSSRGPGIATTCRIHRLTQAEKYISAASLLGHQFLI